ncbi:hypothetical protein GCM10010172_75380 [Paractinoplanes ferrugineus]|uniref:Uncharacterized protein n=1 Tax=Paractinoplanes ferrugineus TaxID=113564 RepID=A0A919J0M1_9ACTN|nr:hypothetical protein [Actinoplanes ferrugineus]GIE11307.1 hypothetical protein Afe05nite_31470 [Actinoplanes ferrugineus]
MANFAATTSDRSGHVRVVLTGDCDRTGVAGLLGRTGPDLGGEHT